MAFTNATIYRQLFTHFSISPAAFSSYHESRILRHFETRAKINAGLYFGHVVLRDTAASSHCADTILFSRADFDDNRHVLSPSAGEALKHFDTLTHRRLVAAAISRITPPRARPSPRHSRQRGAHDKRRDDTVRPNFAAASKRVRADRQITARRPE